MKHSLMILCLLTLTSCGGGSSSFDWSGEWNLEKTSAVVTKDTCKCGGSLIAQLPALNIIQNGNVIDVSMCAGVRCLEVLGNFSGTSQEDNSQIHATGSFGAIQCSGSTGPFNAANATMSISRNDDSTAQIKLIAHGQLGDHSKSCEMSLEGKLLPL